MDCAEMINEKKLRQGFVLATLVSTVAGTFFTSINLYDRLIEQRRLDRVVAQTQIQSQILFQGSVIKLLEEALLIGAMPDINRLYNISEFAGDGNIRALQGQYQRLLESAPIKRRPRGPVRKTSSTPSLREDSSTSSWS
ncbi:hypothetical protein VTG60DRAFT_6333 [Thermothelomyces hinnuleus]